MKKILLTITVLFVTLLTMAQSPNLMNFQGVARNAVGNVIPNQLIGVRLSILSGGPAGTLVYQESRNVFTNAFGLFNIVMGSPGTLSQIGTIAGVNWSGLPTGAASKFLQVEIDPNAGTAWTSVGSTQMVSVPYALNATTAGTASPVGPAGGDLTGTYPNPQILIPLIKSQSVPGSAMVSMTNTSTTGTGGGFFGSSASNDPSANAIQGILTSSSPGVGSAGVRGTNSGSNANGAGVIGTHASSGMGVMGQSVSGVGVFGQSASGAGVYGNSSTGNAGFFENTNSANTATTLFATTNSNGNGTAVNGINSGTSGRGGLFQVTNAANTSSALEAQTAGSGASWGVRSTSTGTNGAGLFVQSNATNTANNVQSNQAGLGTAGLFQTTNTANTADALLATTNTTSTTPAAVHGTAGTSGISVAAKKGVWGDTDAGWGVYGTSSTSVGAGGSTTTGTGVSATSLGAGTGLSATSLTGVSASITSPAGNSANTMNVSTAGTGAAASIDNTNAANVSNTLQATNANGNSAVTSATTGGGAAIFARKGAALGSIITNPTASYTSIADPSAGTGLGVLGVSNNGYAVVGFTLNNGFGVLGQAGTAGSAGVVAFNSGTGYGLVTVGKVQIQGQGAGAGKVLSSDAVGNATWNTLAALGGVSGTGTLNYVPKWTPNGTTLGNSQIFDDGTNVGVGTGSPNAKLDVANGSNTVRGSQMINSSTTNPSSTLFVQNNSIGGADPIESAAMTGLFSPIAVATPIISGPSAIKGIASPNATVGALGGIGVQGASGNGYGVAGISQNGTGVFATGLGGTSYALQTNGRVQIQGQGAAAGKLLSSDATGNATWNTPASLNVVSGNGTLNYMTKWTPDGNTIGNSQVFDNGTNVGIATAAPAYRLDVINGGGNGIRSKSSAGYSTVDIDGNNGDEALRFVNNGVFDWHIGGGITPGAGGLDFYDMKANAYRMVIQNGSGNVGINQTNPVARLDVVNSANTLTGQFVNSNAGNTTDAVYVSNASAGGNAFGLHANSAAPTTYGIPTPAAIYGGSLNNQAVLGASNNNYGVHGASNTNIGVFGETFASSTAGVMGAGNNPNTFGVVGNAAAGTGAGGYFTGGTTALRTLGGVQLTGIGEAAGRVLTSDASGNATWQPGVNKISIRVGGLPGTTVPSGTPTTLIWNSVAFEEGGSNYNTVTGEYTVPATGLYFLSAKYVWNTFANNTGQENTFILVNGAQVELGADMTNNTSLYIRGQARALLQLTAGDKIKIQAFQTTGANASVAGFITADNNFILYLVH